MAQPAVHTPTDVYGRDRKRITAIAVNAPDRHGTAAGTYAHEDGVDGKRGALLASKMLWLVFPLSTRARQTPYPLQNTRGN